MEKYSNSDYDFSKHVLIVKEDSLTRIFTLKQSELYYTLFKQHGK